MSALMRFYPGDPGLDFLLGVTLEVGVASSAAWFLSRRLVGKAALRHLVAAAALVSCLAAPVVARVCSAAGMTLVALPILSEEKVAGAYPLDFCCGCAPSPPLNSAPFTAGEPSSPHNNPTIDACPESVVQPEATQSPATSPLSGPDLRSPIPLQVLFRAIATVVMLVWAAGTALLLALFVWRCGFVVRLRRSARSAGNEAHQVLLREIAAKLGMRQVPLLLVSRRTVVPLAVGLGRPAVILPERLLAAVTENHLRDILTHETAHLCRGDQRIVLLQELAGALYWPILSIHALNRELRRAREDLCDNVVLTGRDPINYGQTLLHIAELSLKTRPLSAAVGIIGGPGKLEHRIRGLIDPRRNANTKAGRIAACVVTFLFIAEGGLASAMRFTGSANAATAPPPSAAQTALGDLAQPPAAGRPQVLADEVKDNPMPPTSAAEQAVGRLVLVFFQDQARRAVSGLLVDSSEGALFVTAGPACIVPDGMPPAIDRAYLELSGKPAMHAGYDPHSTPELFLYHVPGVASRYKVDAFAAAAVGDVLSAVTPNHKGELRVSPKAAVITALQRTSQLKLYDGKVHTFRDLIQLDRKLPEGTPLMLDGQLVGITVLGTRFVERGENKSFAVTAATIQRLTKAQFHNTERKLPR